MKAIVYIRHSRIYKYLNTIPVFFPNLEISLDVSMIYFSLSFPFCELSASPTVLIPVSFNFPVLDSLITLSNMFVIARCYFYFCISISIEKTHISQFNALSTIVKNLIVFYITGFSLTYLFQLTMTAIAFIVFPTDLCILDILTI